MKNVALFHPYLNPQQEHDFLLMCTMELLSQQGYKIFLVSKILCDDLGLENIVLPALFDHKRFRSKPMKQAFATLQSYLGGPKDTVCHFAEGVSRYTGMFIPQYYWPTVKFTYTLDTLCPVGTRYLPDSRKACPYKCNFNCVHVNKLEGCIRTAEGRYLDLVNQFMEIKNREALMMLEPKIYPVAVSNTTMKALLLKHEYPEERVTVIAPPLLTCMQEPMPFPKEEPPTLLFAGPLLRSKGAFDLLQAMLLMKTKPRLVIAGDGAERSLLERDVRTFDLTDRVTFRGDITLFDRLYDYAKTWITVVPSLSQEPIGYSALGSLGCARPVVAYSGVGVEDWVVPGKSGLLVPPGDIAALAQAIDGLLEQPEQVRWMGLWGHQYVWERYNPTAHLEALTRFYDGVIADFKEPPTT